MNKYFMVSASVLKRFRERLGEGFKVLDAWVENVATVMAEVQRVKDGKHYLAIMRLDTGDLELKPR